MKVDPSKILVAVPTRGTPRAETVQVLQAIRDANPGLPPIVYLPTRLSVCDGRNQIAAGFLANRFTLVGDLMIEHKADYLISVDDDIIPNPRLLTLADRGLDIVAAPVLIVRMEASVPYPNVFSWSVKEQRYAPVEDTFLHVDRGTLLECDGVGTGVICLSRKVLSTFQTPFVHEWTSEGAISMTEDLVFCRRAKAAGFDVYADYSVFSDQIVNTNITGLAQKYARAFLEGGVGKKYGNLYLP